MILRYSNKTFLFKRFHGITTEEVYHRSYKAFDDHLRKLNISRLRTIEEVDNLSRNGSINETTANILKEQILTYNAAGDAFDYWRKVFWYAGVPTLIVAAVHSYFLEEEIHENLHNNPPKFIAYKHLAIRTKPFPWGDGETSLFPAKNLAHLKELSEEFYSKGQESQPGQEEE